MKTFRYVSWASNGINDALLRSLSAEIASDLRNINLGLETLAERSDLSAKEILDLKTLISKWKEYESSALDTIEVGSTDAAMATMMLGQTDDKFTAVANDFKSMANSVAAATNTISTKLYTDAAQKKVILAIGAIIGLLLSIVATVLLSRSIVTPIQSVTNVMRRLSSGDTEVEIGYRGRSDEIGQMVEAINVFRKNTIEMRAMEIENLETEKKNLREIGEARARLTDAIETISEGFSLYDADDKLVIFNSKYKTLFSAHADVIEPGTTFETIVRAAVERGMIDDAEGGHEAWLAERIAQHKAPTSAHIQHRSDGRWIQVSERKTAEDGVVATYADITELKRREAELAAARDAAEATLRDLRTAQDRLVQTEKLASLGQLTAGIAHEIKNPLNFVNNFSAISVELIDELREALAGANLDNKLRAQISEIADMLQGNLDKVVQHGKRADSIVKNMLLHSRQGSQEHRPVDINAIVEESLNLAYHGARAEKQGFNITLERSFDPAAGEVDLFPQEITRVLLNLISNGFYAATKRKAEANGGNYEPTLAAATKNLGDSVEIRIRDNGTGIPPEVKAKMFNPFFTTKPVGEGTGLGLSLSYDIIVKQHGGSIEVETQPGEFTEFRIVLPRGAATIAK
jgi:signal transduction histidine kinase/HAMP domain-containing protein